jgi:hypothetical protein
MPVDAIYGISFSSRSEVQYMHVPNLLVPSAWALVLLDTGNRDEGVDIARV